MFSSRNQPDIRPDGPDPLGSDYEPRDRDLDIMVGESLRQIPVPEGLVGRVQQASLARRQQSRMRIGPSRASIAFKRMALAACVGIAAVAAFWMTGPKLIPTGVSPIADAEPVQPVEFPMELLAKADGSGLLASHDLTWVEAHDELLSILEAEHDSDSWGYLAVEIR
ncbi:MAG: hypothetical protein VX527_09875 [Planctomycetota bacterium]|nr:hypothetical protein [Planctomycetota bacterium]